MTIKPVFAAPAAENGLFTLNSKNIAQIAEEYAIPSRREWSYNEAWKGFHDLREAFMNAIQVYDAPKGARVSEDYEVSVRIPGGGWQRISVYEAKVDMHNVRSASMAYFDLKGRAEVRIKAAADAGEAVVRPLSSGITAAYQDGAALLTLDKPCKLSVEFGGDRFGNLHLFANPVDEGAPYPGDEGVLLLQPAIHRPEDIYGMLERALESDKRVRPVLYFAPGVHYVEETIVRVPSGVTVYIAGGAVVAGSFVFDRVEDAALRGRGVIDLSAFHRFSAIRGVRIVHSRSIAVEGVILLDPPHYSIYIGSSEQVRITNFKSFSTRGWSDGIDMMASSDIDIRDVFLRTSDDCIAVYASRWNYRGDTRRISVSDAVLWADVAHPLMMGTHGDHDGAGDTIEDIRFANIDILEHHEPQPNYWGAMAINAGDNNTIRNVTYDGIRVEAFEQGQLVDIRVMFNKDYNPAPGKAVENIVFRNVRYDGDNVNPNRIYGFDEERRVTSITFEGLFINGKPVLNAEQGHFDINGYTDGIAFSPLNDEWRSV